VFLALTDLHTGSMTLQSALLVRLQGSLLRGPRPSPSTSAFARRSRGTGARTWTRLGYNFRTVGLFPCRILSRFLVGSFRCIGGGYLHPGLGLSGADASRLRALAVVW